MHLCACMRACECVYLIYMCVYMRACARVCKGVSDLFSFRTCQILYRWFRICSLVK